MKKPNILLIVADQLSAPALSPYGGTVAKTPHLEDLAESGTVFSTNYCNSPICAPSRFAMLSGRLASRFDVYDSGHEFGASNPTLMHHLRTLGYQTSLSGMRCPPDRSSIGITNRTIMQIISTVIVNKDVASIDHAVLDFCPFSA